jgi:hypothetical protein
MALVCPDESRADHPISFEAGPEKILGRPADLELPNQREARLQCVPAESRRMVPAAQCEVTRSAVEEADARDRKRAGALRFFGASTC